MKTMKSKKVLSISLLFASLYGGLVNAQEFTDININQLWAGGYTDGNVATTRVITTGGTFVGLNTVGQCDRTDAFVIVAGVLDTSAQTKYFEQQYSMLLAAQFAEKPVTVFISGCTSDGRWPRALRVTTQQ